MSLNLLDEVPERYLLEKTSQSFSGVWKPTFCLHVLPEIYTVTDTSLDYTFKESDSNSSEQWSKTKTQKFSFSIRLLTLHKYKKHTCINKAKTLKAMSMWCNSKLSNYRYILHFSVWQEQTSNVMFTFQHGCTRLQSKDRQYNHLTTPTHTHTQPHSLFLSLTHTQTHSAPHGLQLPSILVIIIIWWRSF